jgi:hypothetical protein
MITLDSTNFVSVAALSPSPTGSPVDKAAVMASWNFCLRASARKVFWLINTMFALKETWI